MSESTGNFLGGALVVVLAGVLAVGWIDDYMPTEYAVAAVVFTAASLLGLVGWLVLRYRTSPKRMKGRSTSWATQRDLRKAGLLVDSPQPGRLTVGKTGSKQLAVKREHSLLVIGPVGSMKTTGLVVPNVLEWDGPEIICSAKTDVFHETRGVRSHKGRVLSFDPSGATGVASDGWSPLRKSQTWAGALRMAKPMVSAATGLRDEKFWETGSRQVLAPMLLAASVAGRDMQDVARWVSEENVDEAGAILERLAETDPECRTGLWQMEGLKRKDPKLRGSVFQTLNVALDAYHDPDVLRTSQGWNIHPDALFGDGTQSNTLYISGSQQEQERLAPLFLALIQEFIDAAYDRAAVNRARTGQTVPDGHKPLLLMFDEAANIAPLRSLPNLASTGRSEGIYVCSVYQDVSQIRSAFGDDLARSVFSNHVAKVILPGSTDKETLSTFQQVIGQEDVVERSTSRSADRSVSVSESVRQRDVIGSRELRQLKTGDGVCLYLNHPPARIRLRPYFEDPAMQALVDLDPLQLVPAEEIDLKVAAGEAVRLFPTDPTPVHIAATGEYLTPQAGGYALVTDPTHIAALNKAQGTLTKMAERSQS